VNLFVRQTFDSFIVGRGNQIAYSAALEAAREPGRRHNPLFLYGGTGTGKSHLLNAIAEEILEGDPSAAICRQSYSSFARLIGKGSASTEGVTLRDELEQADALLLDDVRNDDMWLPVQEEMVDWIDWFVVEERQIVLTSDKPLLRLQPLEERFLSRVLRGLIVPLGGADRDVKAKVVSLRMEEEGVELADESLELLSDLPVEDVRELAGILDRLLISLKVEHARPTPSWLRRSLRGFAKRGEIRRFKIGRIAEEPIDQPGGEGVRTVEMPTDIQVDEMAAAVSSEAGGQGGSRGTFRGASEGRRDEETGSDSGRAEGDGGEAARPGEVPALEDIDASEGFIMEWDREIDRLLDEL
jgi:chromosomal replication initiator protein